MDQESVASVERQQPEEEESKSRAGSSRLSYFGQSMEDVSDSGQEEEEEEEESVVEDPPTPSIQRSATTTNVLELAEPIWLRDLDGRRKPPVVKSPPPMESPVWLAVKLRPTALSLVDPDPTGPTSDQTAQLHAHLRLHQRPARSSSCCANPRENLLAAGGIA